MYKIVTKTENLLIRKATSADLDINFFFKLWNSPMVMKNVGFPEGLNISREAIRLQVIDGDDSEYDCKLVVCLKQTGEPIGECKLGSPNSEGVSDTDVKLLPEFWGKGYGTQIKQTLVDYLFLNSSCQVVRATPNRENIASIKMQEAVGGVRISEGLYKFPVSMNLNTCDVPYFEYHVYKDKWLADRKIDEAE